MSQMEIVALGTLGPFTHPSRRFPVYLPDTTENVMDVIQLKGTDGYGGERLFRRLLLPFLENLSDRDQARYLEKMLC